MRCGLLAAVRRCPLRNCNERISVPAQFRHDEGDALRRVPTVQRERARITVPSTLVVAADEVIE
jgi:hypothetical protein